jgi:hypothetical protein
MGVCDRISFRNVRPLKGRAKEMGEGEKDRYFVTEGA